MLNQIVLPGRSGSAFHFRQLQGSTKRSAWRILSACRLLPPVWNALHHRTGPQSRRWLDHALDEDCRAVGDERHSGKRRGGRPGPARTDNGIAGDRVARLDPSLSCLYPQLLLRQICPASPYIPELCRDVFLGYDKTPTGGCNAVQGSAEAWHADSRGG